MWFRFAKAIRLPIAVAIWACIACAAAAAPYEVVSLTQTTPLADLGEILRRTRPPVYVAKIAVHGQGVDPSKESFAVHVPPQKPPGGYALLVFVPPWDEAGGPREWASVLDEMGVIYVSAGHSGNDTEVRTRRMSLALIAAANMIQKYDIDPSRVFVGGFSGGARVALRLALAYPDVFHGAFLNSGGDPIGNIDIPIPPADLFAKFQEGSRLFYITGDNEPKIATETSGSRHSLLDWCVFHVDRMQSPYTGHAVASEMALEKGLTFLLAPATPSKDDLASCRAGVQSRLDTRLRSVEDLVAKGDKSAARRALDDLDAEFGGLAAPRSLDLNAKIGAIPGP
jgi:predicted esterase